jgi:hypothetical protein
MAVVRSRVSYCSVAIISQMMWLSSSKTGTSAGYGGKEQVPFL